MKSDEKKTIRLPSGRVVPAIGLGMWYFGEDAGAYYRETALIRRALEIGYRVFDTAELYGGGGAEEVLGEAVADVRKQVFLTSKVSPEGASYEKIVESCDKSLERLQTDYLDMYLLHWRSACEACFDDILEAFRDLKNDGKIRDFGVSNFGLTDLKDWYSHAGARGTAMNQAYFNLVHRRVERGLLPYCRKKKIPLVAYAPSDVYPSAYENDVLKRIARQKDASPQQTALAWLFAQENIGVLVKAPTEDALKSCFSSQSVALTRTEAAELDAAFPV